MNILITGGTGSLGQALVERLVVSPTFDRICIYSRDEHKQELMKKKFNSDKLRFFIGDVRDKDRLNLACEGIPLIIHAAALKIVPTAEYNPFETLKTNVMGAQNLIECALNSRMGNYPKVLAISTDKAVHPINLYGASKLCAEKLFIAANNIRGTRSPMFSVCRYGNVANSNGSVIPKFKEQIANGEQLSITHLDMTRFYITLTEAVDLVFKSLDIMHGGEIFIPKMQTFNLKQLAMIMMGNYPLEKQWLHLIGIRPGEKLHEIIMTKEELSKSIYLEDKGIFVYHKDYEGDKFETADITSDISELLMSDEQLSKKLQEIGAIE
jgi:UDP-N-acetylglucosamine 4,6-dehydratase